MLDRKTLKNLYIDQKFSAKKIVQKYGCSEQKINYWLNKHKIGKRSISEAIYSLHNPLGDPFTFRKPSKLNEAFLYA